MTTKKLYVGNLPKGCTGAMLSEIFEKFGEVVECDVIRNYGFVVSNNTCIFVTLFRKCVIKLTNKV